MLYSSENVIERKMGKESFLNVLALVYRAGFKPYSSVKVITFFCIKNSLLRN